MQCVRTFYTGSNSINTNIKYTFKRHMAYVHRARWPRLSIVHFWQCESKTTSTFSMWHCFKRCTVALRLWLRNSISSYYFILICFFSFVCFLLHVYRIEKDGNKGMLFTIKFELLKSYDILCTLLELYNQCAVSNHDTRFVISNQSNGNRIELEFISLNLFGK